MTEVHELVTVAVSCHCWNGDRSSKCGALRMLGVLFYLFLTNHRMISIHVIYTPPRTMPPCAGFAMSPNNNEVHIYTKKGSKWEVEHILKEVGLCSCELRRGPSCSDEM